MPENWFITGCSTGLGRALATAVLERGRRAVVTARAPDRVADLVAAHGDRALALPLDVTARLDTLRAGFDAWREVTLGADFPAV